MVLGCAVILDVLSLHLITDPDKDLELSVLRQQIRVLERRVGRPVRLSRVEKLLLTLCALQIKERVQAGQQGFKNSLRLLKPATMNFSHTTASCHILSLVEGQMVTLETANGCRQRFVYTEMLVMTAAAKHEANQ